MRQEKLKLRDLYKVKSNPTYLKKKKITTEYNQLNANKENKKSNSRKHSEVVHIKPIQILKWEYYNTFLPI